jgi:hypothetical protein
MYIRKPMMAYDSNAKPVEIEKTCTWCNGTGRASGTKSSYEILTGGVCSRCNGTGKEKRVTWVSNTNSQSQHQSNTASSSSDAEDFVGSVIGGVLIGIGLVAKYENWKASLPEPQRVRVQKFESVTFGIIMAVMGLWVVFTWSDQGTLMRILGISWLLLGLLGLSTIFTDD